MPQTQPSRGRDARQIIAACLAHLQAEETALDQLEQILDNSRQALVERSTDKLIETGTKLQAHHDAFLTMGKRRLQLLQPLADWLGVATEQVTISRVRRKLQDEHPDAEEQHVFAEVQHRLTERVRQLSGLLRGNAMIAAQHNMIICETLATLTGQTDPHRYGASGQLQSSPASSRFEAEM